MEREAIEDNRLKESQKLEDLEDEEWKSSATKVHQRSKNSISADENPKHGIEVTNAQIIIQPSFLTEINSRSQDSINLMIADEEINATEIKPKKFDSKIKSDII